MADNQQKQSQYIAVAVTLLMAAAIVLLLWWLKLTYPPETPPAWAQDESEILLADEYLTLDEIIPVVEETGQEAVGEPTTGPVAAPAEAPANDIVAEAPPAPAAPVQTQSKPAPAQEIKQPVPQKVGSPQPKKPDEQPKPKENNAGKINSSVGNAFASTNADSRGARPGADNNPAGGNTSQATQGTSPGVSWSSGGGWAVSSRPQLAERYRQKKGSVTVQITVDANGRVVKAEAVGGTPPAGADAAVVNACLELARKYTFKRSGAGAAPQTSVGRITWKI